jgi:hypothetical protein
MWGEGMRTPCVIAALGVAFALMPSPAVAAYDPLDAGSVVITLEPSFARFIREERIELRAVAPAVEHGNKLALPVTGGKFDPTARRGTVGTSGSLVFERGRNKVPLRQVDIKPSRTPLLAKVGGGQLKVASSRSIATTRSGFGSRMTISDLELTSKAVTRLNKKLRPRMPFSVGQTLGRILVNAQPGTVTVLPSGRATLVPAPGILDKLKSLFVSLNPIAPAELAPGPVFTFPLLTKGAIAPDGNHGVVRVGGELEFLQLGGGQIFWREDWFDLGGRLTSAEVDLQPSPPYAGKLGRVDTLDLSNTAVVKSEPTARTIAVDGQSLALRAGAAEAFNQAFAEGKPVFAAGEPFGSLSFEAVGQ